MKVVSLFSGCGGTDLGFALAGHQVLYANDMDSYACETYSKNFPNTTVCNEDIANISNFPAADILVGCYPCQGFSPAGNRNPKDNRNMLYLQFARALKQIQPKFFVVENVKGMLSIAGSRIFKNMLKLFRRCGYNVDYKLLNAKDFGVPQDRERIFIIGVRKDINFEYIFPEPGTTDKNYTTIRQALAGLNRQRPSDICKSNYSYIYMSRNRKRRWDEVSFTIQAGAQHAPLHPSSGNMVKIKKDVMQFTKGQRYRRMSYRECARIQSFPDSFVFCGGLHKKYMQIGNAVPPLLSYNIAANLPLEIKDVPIYSNVQHDFNSIIKVDCASLGQ